MELGGLLLTSVLNLALPPQRHSTDEWLEHQEPVIHMEKEKKGKKNIYRCSQSPSPQIGMIRCVFMYSTDAGYLKLIVEI